MQFYNNLAHNPVTLAISLFERPNAPAAPGSREVVADSLNALVEAVAARRRRDLVPEEENVRLAARDMLRHGQFKPTGRSKPASEYLLGLAQRGEPLPRVMPAVDVANCLSLTWLVPISIWDPRRVAGEMIVFRAGLPGESYVFNSAGHAIDVEDLVCGCAAADGLSSPIVNPVRDSMATKLTADSSEAAMAIYIPRSATSREYAGEALREAEQLLPTCAGMVIRGTAVLDFGESAEF